MRSGIVTRLHKNFEDYVHVQDGVEFWFARDLQNLLGYSEWRNFGKVIEKARESCKTSNHAISDHFVDVNKMIPVPKHSSLRIIAHKLFINSRFPPDYRNRNRMNAHVSIMREIEDFIPGNLPKSHGVAEFRTV